VLILAQTAFESRSIEIHKCDKHEGDDAPDVLLGVSLDDGPYESYGTSKQREEDVE
jgi:hypothetical protein